MAQFYLLYDCQPFSENLIGRSLALILKMSQAQDRKDNMTYCYNVFQMILKMLSRFDCSTLNQEASQKAIVSLVEMAESKGVVRQLISAANDKPKKFYAKIDETYAQIDEDIPARVAAKVLLHSRRVEIDKIAETFGGKDDKSKRCLEQYLQRQDYTTNHVQDSLRSFMQTFRMAGIDS